MRHLLKFLIIVLFSTNIISQNIWERVESLNGGNIFSILCRKNGAVLIGTEYGGLFKSEPDSDSWQLTSEDTKQYYPRFIGEDFNDNLYMTSWLTSGLVKSTDEGANWLLNLDASIFSFKKDTTNNQIIAGSYGQIYKSKDNGLNWTKDSIPSNYTPIHSLEVDEKGNLYVGTAHGLFKQNKNSKNWVRIDSLFESEYIKGIYFNRGNLYAISNINNNALYKSTDYGNSWKIAHKFAPVGGYAVWLESLDFDDQGTMYIALQGVGIAKSVDGGLSFHKCTDIPDYIPNLIDYNIYTQELYAGMEGGGVYVSNDGGNTWNEKNDGIFNLRISDFTVGKNDFIFVGSNHCSFPIKLSTDYGRNWTKTNIHSLDWGNLKGLVSDSIGNTYAALGDKVYKYNYDTNQFELIQSFSTVVRIISTKNIVYILTYNEIFSLDDFGNIKDELPTVSNAYISEIAINSLKKIFAIATKYPNGFSDPEANFYYYDALSNSWTNMLSLEHTEANGVVIDSDDNIYFACSNFNGLLKSTDQGFNWNEIYSSSAYDIIIDSLDDIYITTGYSVLKSTNQGINWMNLHWNNYSSYKKLDLTKRGNLLLSNDYDGLYRYLGVSYPVLITNLNCIITDSLNKITWQSLYDCKNLGFELERSRDSVNWEYRGFTPGNQSDSVKSLNYSLVDTLDNPGKYFYRLKQISTDNRISYSDVIETEYVLVIYSYQLLQNYPNPFNPRTTIEYEVPEKSFVTIKIYDILGREVQTLVINEEKVRYKYKVVFDGSALASGVYFYRMQVVPSTGSGQSFTETKKMVLIK